MSNIFDQFDTAKATQSQPQEPQGQPQTKNIFDQFDSKEQVGQKAKIRSLKTSSINLMQSSQTKTSHKPRKVRRNQKTYSTSLMHQHKAVRQSQQQSGNVFNQFDAPEQGESGCTAATAAARRTLS